MITSSCRCKDWLGLSRDWSQTDDDVTFAAGAFLSERRGNTHLLFFLQDGALEVLRELKNIQMNLETLQVHTRTQCARHIPFLSLDLLIKLNWSRQSPSSLFVCLF